MRSPTTARRIGRNGTQSITGTYRNAISGSFHVFLRSVRTAGVHVDGKAKARRFVFVSPSALGETRGRVQYHATSRHHHGFSQRVLRTPVTTSQCARTAVRNRINRKVCPKLTPSPPRPDSRRRNQPTACHRLSSRRNYRATIVR